MANQDPYAAIAKPIAPDRGADPYASIATPVEVLPPEEPSLGARLKTSLGTGLSEMGRGIEGAAKGAGSTLNSIGGVLFPDKLAAALHMPTPSREQQEGYFKPANQAQAVGKGAEQVGEFLAPGAGEERLAAAAPEAIRPLAKIALSALSSGAVNKAQGGGFGTGALAGGAGGALGEGIRAAAPKLAETALHITAPQRAFSKTPGTAALELTKGVRPESLLSSGRESMSDLMNRLETGANAAPGTGSLAPARAVIGNAQAKAAREEAGGLHSQLGEMGDFLQKGRVSGQPIAQEVPARRLLDLKRGFSDEHLRWNPNVHDEALHVGRKAYGALDKELDRLVPSAAPTNQRISSLIEVLRNAERESRMPGAGQRAIERIGRHTGAATLGGIGGYEGYREGGIPGAALGFGAGVIAPELAASPEGQMALARLASKARALRPAVGAGLQLTRGNK